MTEEAPAIDIGLLHPYLYNSTRITDCQGKLFSVYISRLLKKQLPPRAFKKLPGIEGRFSGMIHDQRKTAENTSDDKNSHAGSQHGQLTKEHHAAIFSICRKLHCTDTQKSCHDTNNNEYGSCNLQYPTQSWLGIL